MQQQHPAPLPVPPPAPCTSCAEPTLSGMVYWRTTATDDTGIANLTLYVDGFQKGTITMPMVPYTSNYQILFDTKTLKDGEHLVWYTGYDLAGNLGTSLSLKFMTKNAGAVADKNAQPRVVTV